MLSQIFFFPAKVIYDLLSDEFVYFTCLKFGPFKMYWQYVHTKAFYSH